MYVVIFADFDLHNSKTFCFGNLMAEFIKPFRYFLRQHFATILYTPDDMVIYVVDTGTSMRIFVHTYSIT